MPQSLQPSNGKTMCNRFCQLMLISCTTYVPQSQDLNINLHRMRVPCQACQRLRYPGGKSCQAGHEAHFPAPVADAKSLRKLCGAPALHRLRHSCQRDLQRLAILVAFQLRSLRRAALVRRLCARAGYLRFQNLPLPLLLLL